MDLCRVSDKPTISNTTSTSITTSTSTTDRQPSIDGITKSTTVPKNGN